MYLTQIIKKKIIHMFLKNNRIISHSYFAKVKQLSGISNTTLANFPLFFRKMIVKFKFKACNFLKKCFQINFINKYDILSTIIHQIKFTFCNVFTSSLSI